MFLMKEAKKTFFSLGRRGESMMHAPAGRGWATLEVRDWGGGPDEEETLSSSTSITF